MSVFIETGLSDSPLHSQSLGLSVVKVYIKKPAFAQGKKKSDLVSHMELSNKK